MESQNAGYFGFVDSTTANGAYPFPLTAPSDTAPALPRFPGFPGFPDSPAPIHPEGYTWTADPFSAYPSPVTTAGTEDGHTEDMRLVWEREMPGFNHWFYNGFLTEWLDSSLEVSSINQLRNSETWARGGNHILAQPQESLVSSFRQSSSPATTTSSAPARRRKKRSKIQQCLGCWETKPVVGRGRCNAC
jgi:hypothetical protein